MSNEIRPIGTLEGAATCWGVAALAGIGAFALLLVLGDWSFLQAAFAGIVVLVALGVVLSVAFARPAAPPSDAAGRVRIPTETRSRADRAGQPGEPAAPAPMTRDRTHAPSPHRTEIERSIVSEAGSGPASGEAGTDRAVSPGPGGTPGAEAAPATRIPGPAPINAADPGVARPVGATTAPRPMMQPTPLHGRIVSPEPPLPLEGEEAGGRIDRNEAAPTGGVRPAPTATAEAQSYNEVDAIGSGPIGGEVDVRVTPRTPSNADEADRRGSSSRTSQTVDDVEADAAAPGSAIWEADGGESDESAREAATAFEDRAPGTGTTTPPPSIADGAERREPLAAVADGGAGPGEGRKPATLDAPRGDGPDDLKQIKGIGPKLEEVLHGMGYYHLDQIAAWSPEEVAWVDSNLEGFRGRVSRDEWVDQARHLAEGGETEFSRRVESGDVY